eukprot:scaffold2033_cov164-Amphora_coffeaeformis.AAC.21
MSTRVPPRRHWQRRTPPSGTAGGRVSVECRVGVRNFQNHIPPCPAFLRLVVVVVVVCDYHILENEMDVVFVWRCGGGVAGWGRCVRHTRSCSVVSVSTTTT